MTPIRERHPLSPDAKPNVLPGQSLAFSTALGRSVCLTVGYARTRRVETVAF